MITVTTTTQMTFKSKEDLELFLETDLNAHILGFNKEIRQARDLGRPVIFSTPRPKYGAVTVSTVSYHEVK